MRDKFSEVEKSGGKGGGVDKGSPIINFIQSRAEKRRDRDTKNYTNRKILNTI